MKIQSFRKTLTLSLRWITPHNHTSDDGCEGNVHQTINKKIKQKLRKKLTGKLKPSLKTKLRKIFLKHLWLFSVRSCGFRVLCQVITKRHFLKKNLNPVWNDHSKEYVHCSMYIVYQPKGEIITINMPLQNFSLQQINLTGLTRRIYLLNEIGWNNIRQH